MRSALVVVLVAGCADDPGVTLTPDPAAMRFDVVVSTDAVMVYARDLENHGVVRWPFPEPGSCQRVEDVGTAAASPCFETIDLGGGAAPGSVDDPHRFPPLPVGGATLTLTGCGRAAQVWLSDDRGPTTSVIASRDPQGFPVATWSAVPHAETALATLAYDSPFVLEQCHAQASPLVFDAAIPEQGALRHDRVLVQALTASEPVRTDLGAIHIWRGETAIAPVQ